MKPKTLNYFRRYFGCFAFRKVTDFNSVLSDVNLAVKQIKNLSPDLIIGGPPCQDFSHAGKRIEASRASLTESYSQIINTIRPKYFVMENVDRAEKSNAFEKAKENFKNAGYGLTQIVLDASKCGVPQKRKRFFCIGALGKEDGFMLDFLTAGISTKETTLRDYFGDTLDFEFYYRHPRNYNRRAVFSIDEPAPTMRGVNRPVPKGYPGHPNDACPISDNIRALTTLKRSLIQTFPATFKWCGNKTDMEQMIGNAVPVKLVEYVASALSKYIKSEEQIETKKMILLSGL
jgi:DNA (cytosine-5)-methyltransferase 1